MDALDSTAVARMGLILGHLLAFALAAVGIVVPLLQDPRAAMLLAPDVKRLEPVGVHARQPSRAQHEGPDAERGDHDVEQLHGFGSLGTREHDSQLLALAVELDGGAGWEGLQPTEA